MRLIPIVFGMTWSEFSNRAPMFADMKAIVVQSPSAARASEVAKDIVAGARFDQRRSRLFEMYFSKLETLYPEDPDIRMWTALFAGDDKVEQLKKALDDGADPNLTDSALWNRYAKKSILEHSDSIFEEWRKLYLFLFDPNNK